MPHPRRILAVLTALLVLLGLPVLAGAQTPAAASPLALVYRGPASVPGTAESVAVMLRNSPSKFRIEYVGPNDTPITAATLARATVFAQPGGPSLSSAWKAMKPYSTLITDWIAAGGNYLGFCVGGYLAGATPGYDLLPGDTSQYSAKRGATVWDTRPARSTIVWRGTEYTTYFQDPPAFELVPNHGATILATYKGGEVAALAANYGRGRIGVVGPHIEADRSWFVDDGLSPDGAVHPQLAYDLIETTVRGNTSGRTPAAAKSVAATLAAPAPAAAAPAPAPAPTATAPAPAPAAAAPAPAPAAAAPAPTTTTNPAPPVAGTPTPTPAPQPAPAGPPLPWPFDRIAELPFLQPFLSQFGPTGAPVPRPAS